MNASAPSTAPSRTAFVAGRDLKVGYNYRCIATGDGTVVDGDTYLLVTNVNDKKGNRQLVNTSNGEVAFATPGSIWSH
ncbi:hypothetical protein Prado_12 [Xylella phage Prado]|uniref:Uncharacterized protein n=3 Tax=Pradovirus TaxID=1985733 RepID=A0A9X9JMR0_9CAUD|nr:hypothetical protein Prado_12 [Xylella phage Prado]AHB12160.1 hypothetical protein Prado_12 [Xylella phage Prado]UYA98637.1 hypothetical protein IVIADoCa4_17 [Xanthomonas phage vB_Xar_IVIA-DoCa4]